MRKREIKRNIPIIALTAYNDERETCLKAGMMKFCKSYITMNVVTKPTKEEENL